LFEPINQLTHGRARRPDVNQTKGPKAMKKIIPLVALMFLAGCGNKSTENQSSPANPPASEQPSNSGESPATNSNPAQETVTNSPATNSGLMPPNGSTGAN
jgi:uncharacterized lipoprotein YajG